MDDPLSPLLARAAELAEALDLGPEFSGSFFFDEGGSSLEGLTAFLEKATTKAHALVDSERLARQAASGLRAAGLAVAGSLDMAVLLEEILDFLNWLVPYEAASVLRIDGSGELAVAAAREWRRVAPRFPSPEEEELARQSVVRALPLQSSSGVFRRLVLPLLGPEGPVGSILLVRESVEEFGEVQVRAAEAFASQAAAAVRNAALYGDLKRAGEELLRSYDASIEALSRALDLRDKETEGHSLRVAGLAVRLGRDRSLPELELLALRRGALLHDIGKIGIPDAILLKAGPLNEEERANMRRHPRLGRELLQGIPFLEPSLAVIFHHHERWDGQGYPDGLAGEAIPLVARIFTVVDVWDALVHDRPYRAAVDPSRAAEELRREAGAVLDPELVDAFLERVVRPETASLAAGRG